MYHNKNVYKSQRVEYIFLVFSKFCFIFHEIYNSFKFASIIIKRQYSKKNSYLRNKSLYKTKQNILIILLNAGYKPLLVFKNVVGILKGRRFLRWPQDQRFLDRLFKITVLFSSVILINLVAREKLCRQTNDYNLWSGFTTKQSY